MYSLNCDIFLIVNMFSTAEPLSASDLSTSRNGGSKVRVAYQVNAYLLYLSF